MTRKFNVLLVLSLVVLMTTTGFSQRDARRNEWGDPKMPENFISKETASDEKVTTKYLSEDGKYYSKPKNMWEIGIGVGHFFLDGDVDQNLPGSNLTGPSGFGVSLHLRKAINYVFSVRGEVMYGRTFGLDPQFTRGNVAAIDLPGLGYANSGNGIHRNYREQHFTADMQLVVNIGNLLFHKERNDWNWYAWIGAGLNHNITEINALDANGNPYSYNGTANFDVNTKDGRKDIKQELWDNVLDDDYETEARQKAAIFRIGDDINIHPEFIAGTSIAYRINRVFNIELAHQMHMQDNDLLDGFVYRTTLDQTNNPDVGHYTSLRFNFNLGNFDKRVEPLYWLNPLDSKLQDIADLKARPELDLTDTDKDGVIDMLDEEDDTPEGCPVDTRGIRLDSDGDGVYDCDDKEPYSPPGYPVDKDGIAEIPEEPAPLTEADIVNIGKQQGWDKKPAPVSSGVQDWWLPMIHFDLDKYRIKPDFYGELLHVATIMKKYPNIRVIAKGHTDNRLPNQYNQVLSYRRANEAIEYLVTVHGIDRSRLVLQYGGEETPLIPALPDNHSISYDKERAHYMNRRVEFKVAEGGETDMPMPAGPDAGKNTPRSSRSGKKYSGNPGSGY